MRPTVEVSPRQRDLGASRREAPLVAFAAEVGPEGAVCAAGGRTHWSVGGLPQPGTREVGAPAGVVSHDPAEMLVRVGAGTTLAELSDAVRAGGQMVALDAADAGCSSVGGLLAVGQSSLLRLRYGAVRDSVLELRYVDHAGRLVRAGAPLVKNVTGFDLCRLMVGSLGTLGLVGEVVLRCFPLPATRQWWMSADGGCEDPFALARRLYRAGAVLWDGRRVWACLEGDPGDVSDQVGLLGDGWQEVGGAPSGPFEARISVAPSMLERVLAELPAGEWLAEMGVGSVHVSAAVTVPASIPDPRVVALNRAVKDSFDPTGRFNPGRDPLSR